MELNMSNNPVNRLSTKDHSTGPLPTIIMRSSPAMRLSAFSTHKEKGRQQTQVTLRGMNRRKRDMNLTHWSTG